MSRAARRLGPILLAAALPVLGCGSGGGGKGEPLLPAETFNWVRQPIALSPPPSRWERQGDGGGGTVGVRFILRGGGGQVMSVGAYRQLAERDRRQVLARLISRRDSLSQREFLDALSVARAREEEPNSEREAAMARAINTALDRASSDYFAGSNVAVAADLDDALRAASEYEPTLEELLPNLRLHPERMQHPEWWRIGYERDTVVAGLSAFASDDTLYAPEQVLLYHQVFWVVKGCAFVATFQGRQENLDTFHRVLSSVQFPESDHASP